MKISYFLPMVIAGEKINGGVPKVLLNNVKISLKNEHEVTVFIHTKCTALLYELKQIKSESLSIVTEDFEVPTLSLDEGGFGFWGSRANYA